MEIKKGYLYEIKCYSMQSNILWHCISECYNLSNDYCYFKDVAIIIGSSNSKMEWDIPLKLLLNVDDFKVKEIGLIEDYPEYLL